MPRQNMVPGNGEAKGANPATMAEGSSHRRPLNESDQSIAGTKNIRSSNCSGLPCSPRANVPGTNANMNGRIWL